MAGSLSSGILLAADTPFLKRSSCYWNNTPRYIVDIETNSLTHSITADAAEAFGQKLFTFPLNTFVVPVFSYIAFTLDTPTGLSAAAGEVGLGTTIASGAVAVLSGTAGFEDIHRGKTIADLVAANAAVTETSGKGAGKGAVVAQTSADTSAITASSGEASAADLTLTQALQVDYDKAVADITAIVAALNATSEGTTGPLDNTSSAKSVHGNIASTWNQGSAENLTFSVRCVLAYDQYNI